MKLGCDYAQLLESRDNGMTTDSNHRARGAGTGISSLKSAVEAQGGDLDQIIETDQHELRLSLPLTAPARDHEPQANSTPLGSDDDPSVELGAARMRGNKRLAIAA